MKETILDVLLFLFENYFYEDPDASIQSAPKVSFDKPAA